MIEFRREFEKKVFEKMGIKGVSNFNCKKEIRIIQPKKFREGRFLRFKIFSEDLGVGAFVIEERVEKENGFVRVVGHLYFFKKGHPVKMFSHEERSTWDEIDENFFIFSIKSIEGNHLIFYQKSRDEFVEKIVEL